MKISVVIPALNEEKYLPLTLASLAKQTRPPDEIIIVDGGSTDKTVDIAQKAGAQIVAFTGQTIGAARQKGLEAASGDVVACTDADTIVPTDWLSKIEQALSQPHVSCAYGGYKVSSGWWPYRFWINVIDPIQYAIADPLGIRIAAGQNHAYWKQKALEIGGYPADFKSMEDYEIVKRLAKVGKVKFMSDNYVISDGRRGNEGWILFWRIGTGVLRYLFTKKTDTFDFPDMR